MAILSITIPDEQVPRVLASFGHVLALRDLARGDKPATAAEMRGIIIDNVRQVVLAHERKLAREQAEAGVTEITPT